MSTSSEKSSSDEIIDYCEQNEVNYITSLECFRKDFEVKFSLQKSDWDDF